MRSRTLDKISNVILVFGIIGSFLSGEMFKTVEVSYSYVSDFKYEYKYNWQLCLTYLLSIIIFYIILLAISSILENTEQINYEQKKILKLLDNSYSNINNLSEKTDDENKEENMIRCSKCNSLQPSSRKVCWNCGISLNYYENTDSTPVFSQKSKPVTPKKISDGRMECPKCGELQPSDRNICWNCGTSFKK